MAWGWGGEVAQEGGGGGSLWHYGRRHHLDVYGPTPFEERERQEFLNFEDEVAAKKKEAAAHPLSDKEVEVFDANVNFNLSILKRHISRLREIHRLWEAAADKESLYVYNPADFKVAEGTTFEDWKRQELRRLVERRSKAMEVDALRPDCNRRAPPVAWWQSFFLKQDFGNSDGSFLPHNWPKRRYYYPVTNFALLEDPSQKAEEELELEQRVNKKLWDYSGLYVLCTSTVAGLYIMLKRHKHPVIPLIPSVGVGCLLEFFHTQSKAAPEKQDLDDYVVAKHVWFVKNRPELFDNVNTGLVQRSWRVTRDYSIVNPKATKTGVYWKSATPPVD